MLQEFLVKAVFFRETGLMRLQQIFRALSNNSLIWFSVIRFRDVTRVHDELRSIDNGTTRSVKTVVLDLSTDLAYQQVLKQVGFALV